ncbi:MIP/aquaporin family protein [Streptomyces sp. NPDC052225]|uniref:MIP/aquaporin family protein n=1 Tax=Streptomyces sp. NPDC052225 TaxID=3154949 RepID=UPI00343C5BBF
MSSHDIFLGETIGTAVLILLGGGVCAAVTLKRSKAQNAGWLAITFGWGFAVLTGAYLAGGVSGAHLNPAVTIGLAIEGGTKWSDVPLYLASQLLGAMIGAVLVWLTYYGQFQAHLTDEDVLKAHAGNGEEGMVDPKAAPKAGPVLGIFSTGPEIRNAVQNLLTEIIATIVLVLAILTQGLNDGGNGLGTLGALITALVVVGIGLSLGGPTGYAINPVRDLGPRIVHSLLPLPNKGGSDWSYAWIPVAGPLIGGALAGLIYKLF